MPTPLIPPYAKVEASLDGGPIQSGGLSATVGQSCQLSTPDVAQIDVFLWEIVAYPPGFATPAGWTLEPVSGAMQCTAPTPPAFMLSPWGKWLFRLTVNGGRTLNAMTSPAIDEATGVDVPSPDGVHDLAPRETTQWSTREGWLYHLRRNLRAGGGGGSASPSTLVYRPGATTAGNVYGTEAELLAAFPAAGLFDVLADASESRIVDVTTPWPLDERGSVVAVGLDPPALRIHADTGGLVAPRALSGLDIEVAGSIGNAGIRPNAYGGLYVHIANCAINTSGADAAVFDPTSATLAVLDGMSEIASNTRIPMTTGVLWLIARDETAVGYSVLRGPGDSFSIMVGPSANVSRSQMTDGDPGYVLTADASRVTLHSHGESSPLGDTVDEAFGTVEERLPPAPAVGDIGKVLGAVDDGSGGAVAQWVSGGGGGGYHTIYDLGTSTLWTGTDETIISGTGTTTRTMTDSAGRSIEWAVTGNANRTLGIDSQGVYATTTVSGSGAVNARVALSDVGIASQTQPFRAWLRQTYAASNDCGAGMAVVGGGAPAAIARIDYYNGYRYITWDGSDHPSTNAAWAAYDVYCLEVSNGVLTVRVGSWSSGWPSLASMRTVTRQLLPLPGAPLSSAGSQDAMTLEWHTTAGWTGGVCCRVLNLRIDAG